jgi:Sigma-70, region 4
MNAALMVRRKRKNTRCPFHEMDAPMSSFAETVPDTQPNPELAYSRTESYKILDAHLKELNPLFREAIVTTYYDELSVTEASSALGVPSGTYKARLFRGRRLLQQRAIPITRVNSHQTKEADPDSLIAPEHCELTVAHVFRFAERCEYSCVIRDAHREYEQPITTRR